VLAGAALAGSLHAADGNTLGDELRIFSEEMARQCKSVKEQLESFKVRADPLTGYNLKDAVQSLCVCLPEKAQAFRSTLTTEDLARELTAEEFLGLFNPPVIDKCAAEQMQSMYGEDCRKRFRKTDLDVPKYCACMKEVTSGYSEATSAEIAAAASEYLPMAAEAEQKGEPAPTRPPILEAYYQADQGCKAPR
jgi:hypothetical protein